MNTRQKPVFHDMTRDETHGARHISASDSRALADSIDALRHSIEDQNALLLGLAIKEGITWPITRR